MSHERFSDENGTDSLGSVFLDVLSPCDTTESDEDDLGSSFRVLLLDNVGDPRSCRHVDVEIVQVAVVDSDNFGSHLERSFEFFRVVDFDQRFHSSRDRMLVKLGEFRIRKHSDDEKDGVGSVNSSLIDLVRVEDEILSKYGGSVREGVDRSSNCSHVI